MSFRLLLSIIDNSWKNSSIRGHDGWIENQLYILMLMRRYLNFFRLNIEGKLLDCILGFLLDWKFHIASYFIAILYFEFLNNAFGWFGWYECSKIKYPFIYEENIAFD